ncbi:protein of unknown function [Candidatus Hydrogenisulfobacillus filiaventi]|uniref:Uncharacterized protein n=1 Tax=Candidatus Hydrogenisulfobacillus filiaventi TaxID=2707344 RepID=A0A6F8ZGH5_9FIRM|nr:protein of unknown function [Candidatus Hydrogenisulfobacillus filiaventi]
MVFRPRQQGTPCRFPHTPAAWAPCCASPVTPDTRIAREATGKAFTVSDALVSRARLGAVTHPVAWKRLGAGRHPDRGDAERLAQMLALGTVEAVWGPPAAIRAIRALRQQAAACGSTATARKHRAQRRLLRRGGPCPGRKRRRPGSPTTGRNWTGTLLVTSARTLAQPAVAEAEVLRRLADRPARGWPGSLPGWGPGTAAVVWTGIRDPRGSGTSARAPGMRG